MHSAVRFARIHFSMRSPKHVRNFCFAITLCMLVSLISCGGKDAASPAQGGSAKASASEDTNLAEPPLDQQTEQKLDPLTKEDVDLYLKVMRAAAEHVKHLTPADQAALDGAKKILASSASGRVPTKDDVKTLERANLVALYMDQIVAEEMNLDGHTYRGIAEAVETVFPASPPGAAPARSAAPAPGHTPTPLEKHLEDIKAANEKFLAPYRDEIQQLLGVVRNPANLPK
jgi:hypothetical protein